MKVEPLLKYRRPKYPRIGEGIPPSNAFLSKNAAIIAATIAISGALSGCLPGQPPPPNNSIPGLAGAPPQPPPLYYLSEQEIIQILKYEARDMGIALDSKQAIAIKYSDIDITLDLYNEEKQIGAAVLDMGKLNQLHNQVDKSSYDPNDPKISNISKKGAVVKGSLEDEQPVDVFLASKILNYREDDLRQAFREFIEWLQSEGII